MRLFAPLAAATSSSGKTLLSVPETSRQDLHEYREHTSPISLSGVRRRGDWLPAASPLAQRDSGQTPCGTQLPPSSSPWPAWLPGGPRRRNCSSHYCYHPHPHWAHLKYHQRQPQPPWTRVLAGLPHWRLGPGNDPPLRWWLQGWSRPQGSRPHCLLRCLPPHRAAHP